MQHRIIVADTLAGVPVADAQRHWREQHTAVYAPAPSLLGYVQNRPLEEEWERLGSRSICSETWFADQASERASFASDYYRDVVMPDESRFIDRSSAWMGRFLTEPARGHGRARYRVLALGAASLDASDADVLELDRAPWSGGMASLASVWLDDRDRALALARGAGTFAFAAEPVLVVPPPGSHERRSARAEPGSAGEQR
jgi:hypothetical protein